MITLSRRRRVLLALLLLAAGLGLTAHQTRGWWLPRWGRWLDASEPPRPADYALVLGGGTENRPFVAAALAKKGYVKQVLLTRVRPTPEMLAGVVPREEEQARRALELRGVPAGAIVTLPGEVDSTFDEAQVLNRFLDDHPGATVAVVTTAFHTRRSRAVFRRVLGPRATQVYFVAAPADDFDAATWWESEAGFVTYLTESVKSAYYAVRY